MGGENMLQNLKSRTFAWMAGTAVAVVAVGAMFVGAASAQNKEPIKIGFGMSLSGPLPANGKQALLGVDKVELVVGGYATNMNAPAMPVVMQKGKTYISLFALDVNHEFKYPKYFSVLPTGPQTKP